MRYIAGAEAVPANAQQSVVVGQVLAGEIENRFSLKRLDKGAAQIENQSPFEIGALECGDLSALFRTLQPKVALIFPLVQVAG